MKNKHAKQMICSVLNRDGFEFGYYSIIGGKNCKYNYALRLYGQPINLRRASAMANTGEY